MSDRGGPFCFIRPLETLCTLSTVRGVEKASAPKVSFRNISVKADGCEPSTFSVSLAVWQHVTVTKGQTVDLSCPIIHAHQSVEWKNPEGYIMFFKHNQAEVSRGVKDQRYTIKDLSESEFTISISDVTFKDGGNYTCSHYDTHITEKTVLLTVLGNPIITKVKRGRRFDMKCIAEGNHYPPQIFWKLDHGPEILANSQVLQESERYVSKAMLSVQSVENRVTVECLVHHPALYSQPLIDFVKIGKNAIKASQTTTTRLPTAHPQRPTEVRRTTTSWLHGRTTVYLTTRDVTGFPSESSKKLSTVPSSQLFSSNEPNTVTTPTGLSVNPVTSTGSLLSTNDSFRERNDTISNTIRTTGWTSVSETTEVITSYNHTEGNTTGSFNGPKMQTRTKGNSPLLVLLVTCLIFGLLVVVIFFAMKLRRAHITWKRENDDSDPSEESSKSKSSQEEKNSQGQRRRGLFNTAFTQYVVEEPPVIFSVINTTVMPTTETENKEQTERHTSAKCDIKETEL
ncbi:cell adhesion molecule 2 isoform X2 [Acanthopagrus latus]|uniref:cell adhesion molecule 2 isoform X2 n=1 Tax=Acanthopagrus latus TaxID=8177 RepID=UPI00187BD606|nr:cell adhesion molecule 2 isoform X2 [Acanthopagrus latus]